MLKLNYSSIYSSTQTTALQNEIKAIGRLLNRSFTSDQLFIRSIGTTLCSHEKQESAKQGTSESSSTEKPSENKSTEKSTSNDKKPPPKPRTTQRINKRAANDDDNDDSSPLLQTMLKYSAIALGLYMITRLISTPGSNISYQSFQSLLAAGEVKELALEQSGDRVFVYLHPGAMLNGTPINSPYFILNVPNMDKFEERVQEEEEKLGIRDG